MSALAAALWRLMDDREEPAPLPQPVGWGVCMDCDKPCHLDRHGRCTTCGSGSTTVWRGTRAA